MSWLVAWIAFSLSVFVVARMLPGVRIGGVGTGGLGQAPYGLSPFRHLRKTAWWHAVVLQEDTRTPLRAPCAAIGNLSIVSKPR